MDVHQSPGHSRNQNFIRKVTWKSFWNSWSMSHRHPAAHRPTSGTAFSCTEGWVSHFLPALIVSTLWKDKTMEQCMVKDPPPLTQSKAPPYSCVMKETEKNVLELESHFQLHYWSSNVPVHFCSLIPAFCSTTNPKVFVHICTLILRTAEVSKLLQSKPPHVSHALFCFQDETYQMHTTLSHLREDPTNYFKESNTPKA